MRALTRSAFAAVLGLAVTPAGARPLHDTAADFRIDVLERGVSCVLVPPMLYDANICPTITQQRPDIVFQQAAGDVRVVAAEVVRPDGWTYMIDVLREARSWTPAIVKTTAETIATAFVEKMRPSLSLSGVTVRRDGTAELSRRGDVQIVKFEVAASAAPESAIANIDRTIIAMVVADSFTYTVEFHGPSSHADDLREIACATLNTVHASSPRPSRAYATGIAAVRVAAIVFAAAVVLALTLLAMHRR
jgi:hypothetical protein